MPLARGCRGHARGFQRIHTLFRLAMEMCWWPTLPLSLTGLRAVEQLGLGDSLASTPAFPGLTDAMRSAAVKLLARLGVLQRRVVAGHGRADAPQLMPYRAWFRHMSGSSSHRQRQEILRRNMHILQNRPLVTDARRDHLPCTSCAEKPGRSV